MIRDIRLRLANPTADYNQAICTCGRRHVSIHGGGGGFLLRFFLIFCCVTITCSYTKDKISRGIKDLQIALKGSPHLMGHCDLETDWSCEWFWQPPSTNEQSTNPTFKKVTTSASGNLSKYFPTSDANKSANGTEILDQSYVFAKKHRDEIIIKLNKKKDRFIYIYKINLSFKAIFCGSTVREMLKYGQS